MFRITTNYKRILALISDLHVGSRYGLFPRGIKTPQGNELKLNEGQEALLEYWNNFWNVADKWKVDTVIDFGDSIHGLNHKDASVNLMCAELDVQKQAYFTLVKPHLRRRGYYNLTGSGYHDSKDTRAAIDIAGKLDGKFLGALSNLKLNGTKRILNVAHGVGGAMIYRATIMDREGVFQLASQAVGKIPKVDIICRGHLHYFLHLHLTSQHILQLPCWLAYEPNKIMLKSYGKMQPDIGAVILFIDEADRIDVHHYVYPTPHIDDFIKNI